MAERATAQNSPGPPHREADNGHWIGDDVMTFGIEVGPIGRQVGV